MTVGEVKRVIRAENAAGDDDERSVSGCFMCDGMSRTMANGFSGMAWITHRADMNALAVAVMKGAACMIFPKGTEPEEGVIGRAEMENMPLLRSDEPAFELAGLLYEAGLRGEESE